MRAVVLAVVMLASACAPTLTGANEAGGIVNANFNMGQGKAVALADAHCRKYGKVVRVSSQNEIRNNMRFDCVKPTE